MSSDKIFLSILGVVAVLTFVDSMLDKYTETEITKVAIQNGLQQCRLNQKGLPKFIWKKECLTQTKEKNETTGN